MNCHACGTTMNTIPEADPPLLRCPNCWNTIPKPKATSSKETKTRVGEGGA